ncbi:hypothetical protein IMZ48_08565 [Candidatus Bathyarchaeota archaeon]|nr:hypothetical protein [Candidatus Bathyarchaeota archaeon]
MRLRIGKWTCSSRLSHLMDGSVKRLWLGCGKYVIQKKSGKLVWYLQGCYKKLDNRIREYDREGVEVEVC